MDELEQWKGKLQDFASQAQQKIQEIPELQLYTATGVLTLTVLVSLFVSLFKHKKPHTVILAGLSGSGKTVLYYQLRNGSSHQGTVTSMEPNERTFALHSETDGMMSQVTRAFDLSLMSTCPWLEPGGVIFLVDAVDFTTNASAVAEYLYDILTNASFVRRKIPVLIVYNKTDKVTAHSKEFIRKYLTRCVEQELE